MKKKMVAIVLTVAFALPFFGGSAIAREDVPKVDINVADAEALMELPGVGEKVAERIVAFREEHGPFEAPEEIMNVRGIGEKTYLKLESYLTVSTGESRKKK